MRTPPQQATRRVQWLLALGLTLGAWPNPCRAAGDAPAGPVRDDEVKAFANAVEKAIHGGDSAAFTSLIDWNAIVDKAEEGVDAPQAMRNGFREGILGSLEKPQGFAGQMVAAAKKGGSYQLLRTRVRGKRKTALFRLVHPNNGGLNYHEFELSRRPDGKVRAVDIYIYLSGELFSSTIRRSYVQLAAQQSRGVFARLLGSDQEFLKSVSKLGEMTTLSAAGRNREALDVYNGLPPAVQNEKTFLLIRLQVAQKLGEAQYAEAIARFRALYPNDACVDILSIDGFVMMKQYDKSLAATDRLDKSLGGDPYLNLLRAGIYLSAGQPEKARAVARTGVQEAPDLLDVYWALLGADLKLNDFPAAIETLKSIDNRFHIQFNDLTTNPEFAGFVKSPQFEEWTRYQKRKAAKDEADKD